MRWRLGPTADADRLILVQFLLTRWPEMATTCFISRKRLGGAVVLSAYPDYNGGGKRGDGHRQTVQHDCGAVRNGDVLTVYLDGLAGDTTTPDTSVRWFELDSMVLAATQGAITWDQQVISANVDSEGALHLVNSNTNGVGVMTSGARRLRPKEHRAHRHLRSWHGHGRKARGAVYGTENNASGASGRGVYDVALNTGGRVTSWKARLTTWRPTFTGRCPVRLARLRRAASQRPRLRRGD